MTQRPGAGPGLAGLVYVIGILFFIFRQNWYQDCSLEARFFVSFLSYIMVITSMNHGVLLTTLRISSVIRVMIRKFKRPFLNEKDTMIWGENEIIF